VNNKRNIISDYNIYIQTIDKEEMLIYIRVKKLVKYLMILHTGKDHVD
jgi:hypothetical protein